MVSGATTGGDPPAELGRMFWRGLTVMGSSMGTLAELERLCDFMERAGVRPVVDSEFPIERAPRRSRASRRAASSARWSSPGPGPPAAEEAVAWAEAALTETRAMSAPSPARTS